MSGDVSFTIDKQIVEAAIRERIAAAITRELGNADVVMAKAIELALQTKVNERGVKSSYDYENKHPFIEAMASNAIREAATVAVRAWIEEHKASVVDAVKSQLTKQRSKIAAALVDSLAQSSRVNFSVAVNVSGKDL